MLFSHIVGAHFSFPSVSPDFLSLVANSLEHLHRAGRSNVVYNFVYALGTLRRDGTDTLLPVARMPMGLMEYTVSLFCESSLQKVHLNLHCIYMYLYMC